MGATAGGQSERVAGERTVKKKRGIRVLMVLVSCGTSLREN